MHSFNQHEMGEGPRSTEGHEIEATILDVAIEDGLPHKIITGLWGTFEYRGNIDAHLFEGPDGSIVRVNKHLKGDIIVLEHKREIERDPHCISYHASKLIVHNLDVAIWILKWFGFSQYPVVYRKSRVALLLDMIINGTTERIRFKFDRFPNDLSVLKVEAKTKWAIIHVMQELDLDSNKLVSMGPKELLQHSHHGISVW